MGIITDISIPTRNVEIAESLSDAGDTTVWFESLVPTNGAVFPYLWAATDDHEKLLELFEVDQTVRDVDLIYRRDDRGLYELEWTTDSSRFLSCIVHTDATVLYGGGSATNWRFKLRFESHDHLSQFQQACLDRDISLSVDRIVTKSVVDPPGEKLTQPQRETIELALERGYFDVPRKTTMVELAEELGISDQAVSARIRRAMRKLSQQLLSPDDESVTTQQD